MARLDQDEGVLGGLTVTGLNEASRTKHDIPERITRGVVVQEVAPGGHAAGADIQPADVILELNREAIKDVEHFTRLYKAARGRILLLVYRDGNTLYLLLSK